jgi:hypothetical protein
MAGSVWQRVAHGRPITADSLAGPTIPPGQLARRANYPAERAYCAVAPGWTDWTARMPVALAPPLQVGAEKLM